MDLDLTLRLWREESRDGRRAKNGTGTSWIWRAGGSEWAKARWPGVPVQREPKGAKGASASVRQCVLGGYAASQPAAACCNTPVTLVDERRCRSFERGRAWDREACVRVGSWAGLQKRCDAAVKPADGMMLEMRTRRDDMQGRLLTAVSRCLLLSGSSILRETRVGLCLSV